MSKFHSTVSRRDFMKGLGLAGAGLGAAAAAVPVIQDLDQLAASQGPKQNLPWWVSERDAYNPTVEVDWDPSWRVDGRKAREYRNPDGDWYFNAYSVDRGHVYADYENKFNPEFNWKDPRRMALDSAARGANSFTPRDTFVGLPPERSPESKGYPKWQGTAEENQKLIRGIVRYLGGDDIGVLERDTKCERIITTYDMSGYKIDFENVDAPYQTEDPKRRVIPSSFKWSFNWTFRQAMDLTRRQEGGIMRGYPEVNPLGVAENASVWYCYSRMAIVEHRLQTFIRALGYDCVAGGMNAIMAGSAHATMSGTLEHGRMGQIAIHPKYGATVRGTYKVFTNLPLVPTKPIDAGIYEFCKTCQICADLCPGGIIQKNEPTWTTGRNPEKGDEGEPLPYQSQGFLGWRTDIGKCPHCPVCQGTCPFNELPNGSFVHTLVKSTVATTPLFNGFFTQLHKTFGYGRKYEQDFWEHFDELPTYGIDTMR